MTVAVMTTAAFAERCWKRSAPLNSTGLGASVVALFYSVYGEHPPSVHNVLSAFHFAILTMCNSVCSNHAISI